VLYSITGVRALPPPARCFDDMKLLNFTHLNGTNTSSSVIDTGAVDRRYNTPAMCVQCARNVALSSVCM
jgi:hypothetical protein